MKKKILSIALALCLIIPTIFMLTACGGKTPPNNGGENPPVLTYSDYFNGVKVLEHMSFEDMSETGEAYLFTQAVMEQIDTLATEILLRLCGHFGLGLTVELAESYGITIAEDIVPETTAEWGMYLGRWIWCNVEEPELISMDISIPEVYIEVYFNAYPTVEKENYKDKLVANLYKLLLDVQPANLEAETLRELAKKFDHLGFFEEEIDSITDFIFDNIIGEDNCYIDKAAYNPTYDRYGYFNYEVLVPQLVLDCVNRMVDGEAVYPVSSAFQFSEKTVESFGVNSTGAIISSASQYRSLVFNAKKVFDITSLTLLFDIPTTEITNNVNIKISSKYQFYNQTTETYEVVRATLGTVTITPGTGKTEDFTVEFAMSAFINNTPLQSGQTYVVGQNDALNYNSYFENYYNGSGYNMEYVDDNTSFLQLFFEFSGNNKNINFAFGFSEIGFGE